MPALALYLLLVLPLGTSPGAATGPWAWPLTGVPTVDRPFVPPATAYGAGHRGVDLRAAAGTPVLAAGAGTVTYVGLLAGRGVVTVSHAGGLRTTYEPVAGSVRLGQVVTLGARLGTVTTGHATCRLGTTCLHWGLLRRTVYLNPLSLLGRTRVRLLPLGAGGLRDLPWASRARVTTPAPRPTGRSSAVADRPVVGGAAAPAVAAAGVAGVGAALARRRRRARPVLTGSSP